MNMIKMVMLLLISFAVGATTCFAPAGMPRRRDDAERRPAAVRAERAAIPAAAAAKEPADDDETEDGETSSDDDEWFAECGYCGREHHLNKICQPYCIQCDSYHEEGIHIIKMPLTGNKRKRDEAEALDDAKKVQRLINHGDLLKTLEQPLICPDCLQRIKNHYCGCATLVYDVRIGNVNP